MNQPRIAVVILNFATRNWLEKFVPLVLKTQYPNFELVIADNASTDGSVSFMKKHYPEVRLIQFEQNYGFTGGYNKALKEIEADYYVLLNSDIEVTENWLQPLVDLAEKDRQIAAIQPLILDWKDKTKYEYAGAAGGFIDLYGYPFCRGRVFDTVETRSQDYETTREVFWATGACLFINAQLYHEAGGLEDRFFAHMEEIDLCWRLKNKGYKIYCCAESQVYHVGGATLAAGHPRKTYLNFHNSLAYLAKNLPSNKLFGVIVFRLILDHVAAYRFLFMGQGKNFLAIAKAHFVFITGINKWLKSRDKIKPAAKHTGILNKSIVLQYFVKGKKHFRDLTGIS